MRHSAQDPPDLGCEGPVIGCRHCTLVGRMGPLARWSCKIELLFLRLWPNRFVCLGSPYLGYCCGGYRPCPFGVIVGRRGHRLLLTRDPRPFGRPPNRRDPCPLGRPPNPPCFLVIGGGILARSAALR